MTEQLAQLIKEACDEEGVEVSVCEKYSGRFMFGEITFAITLPQHTQESDVQMAVSRYCEENEPRISSFSSDSLGLGRIIY